MVFLRKDANKKKKLSQVWRKPKGMHNKRRLSHAGHAKTVSPGFKKSAGESGMYHGKVIKFVEVLDDLSQLDAKVHAAQIKKISKRNKISILKECKAKGITVVNLNVDKYLKVHDVKKAKTSVKSKDSEKSKDAKGKESASSKQEQKAAGSKEESDKK